MALVTVTVALLFAQAQFAPSDVPKSHWAYPAVNGLFQEGLLKGYPGGKQSALKLDKSAKQDMIQLKTWIKGWKARGLLVGYPNGWDSRGREPSAYEQAVKVHTVWASIAYDHGTNTKRSSADPNVLPDFPNLVKAISMLDFELTKLGADTKMMISALNDLQDSSCRVYLGSR